MFTRPGPLVNWSAWRQRPGIRFGPTNTVTSLKNGSSVHLTPNGDSVLLFTDQGNLIRARRSYWGYQELSRVHLIDATYPLNGRNVVCSPPAFANRHVFARNEQELVCAPLAATPE